MSGVVLAIGTISGCGPAPKSEVIQVKAADPMAEVKSVLQRYADGQPLGSEASGFPALVETAKKASPEKGEILEKAFADLQKKGANIKAIAKDALTKLGS